MIYFTRRGTKRNLWAFPWEWTVFLFCVFARCNLTNVKPSIQGFIWNQIFCKPFDFECPTKKNFQISVQIVINWLTIDVTGNSKRSIFVRLPMTMKAGFMARIYTAKWVMNPLAQTICVIWLEMGQHTQSKGFKGPLLFCGFPKLLICCATYL